MRESQLISDDSQLNRNVPDVLFVDEEGNPIEAGHENILYTDENGNEISEEIALHLLESGKYIDSRDLYQSQRTSQDETHANNGADSQPSFYPSHASLPASAFGSLSKSTGAYHFQVEMMRKESRSAHDDAEDPKVDDNVSTSDHMILLNASSQAQIFAQVQAEMQEMLKREEELAQIEADANRNTLESRQDNSSSKYSDLTRLENVSRYSSTQSPTITNATIQNETARCTFDNTATMITTQENNTTIATNKYSESSSQNNFSKSQSQRRLPQPPPKKSDSIIDFNDSNAISENNLSTLILLNQKSKNKQESLNESSYYVQDESYGEHEESYGGQEESFDDDKQHQNKSKSSITSSVDAKTVQDQQQYEVYLKDDILRRQTEIIYEQRQYQESRATNNTTGTGTGGNGSTISGGYREEVGTNCSTPCTGVEYQNVFDTTANSTTALSNYTQRQAEAESTYTTYTPLPNNTTNQTPTQVWSGKIRYNDDSKSQSKPYQYNTCANNDFKIERPKQVGHLTGNQIIYNLNNIDFSQFEHFYNSNCCSNQDHQQDTDENNDLYNADLFKDELVDIDFGVIDAFTSALNAQINAEKNAEQPSNNLHFPSHVLTSKYATFLDTQIFLSDSSGLNHNIHMSENKKSSNNFCQTKTGGEGNNHGISIQLLSSLNDLDQSTFNNTANINILHEENDEQNEDDEDDGQEYSRSNSCGSFADCKSQGGYSNQEFFTQYQPGSVGNERKGCKSERESRSHSNFLNIMNEPHQSNLKNNATSYCNNSNVVFDQSYIDIVKSKHSVASNDVYNNLKNMNIHNR